MSKRALHIDMQMLARLLIFEQSFRGIDNHQSVFEGNRPYHLLNNRDQIFFFPIPNHEHIMSRGGEDLGNSPDRLFCHSPDGQPDHLVVVKLAGLELG